MKREKLDTLKERDLVVGLITSDKFCREVITVLNPRLLELEYARILTSWIKDFYSLYKKAPKKDILKLYRSRCEDITDESMQENILTFVEKLDEDYDDVSKFNDDFAIKESIEYLKGQSLKNLISDIDSYILSGDITKAENAITKYKTIERNDSDAVSILNNVDAVMNAFMREDNKLFQFPGAYGKVVGAIHREDFIAYLAPMKRGKTWALIDAGVEAMKNGLKAVFVTLEMSEDDMIKRIWTAITGDIAESKDDIFYSYFEDVNPDAQQRWKVSKKIIERNGISVASIARKQKSLKRLFHGGDYRVISVPAYTLTVEQLEIKLERLAQQEGFIPDVICVDYADIMAPSDKADYRHQLDGIWKRLRGLAQKRKCVVFTASQSGRDAIEKDADAQDIAEDIRKLAHITSMVSLNQSVSEKKNGVIRLKQIVLREGESEFRQAVCTQCLTIGRLVTDSRFEDEVIDDFAGDAERVISGARKRNRR